MQLTREQFTRIEHVLPVQRGNVVIDNFTLINAILFIAVTGCAWRDLPDRYGRWHTVYMRMNRWAKSGVLDKVFEELQVQNMIRVKIEVVQTNPASVEVPEGDTDRRSEGNVESLAVREEDSTPKFIWLPRATKGFLASS